MASTRIGNMFPAKFCGHHSMVMEAPSRFAANATVMPTAQAVGFELRCNPLPGQETIVLSALVNLPAQKVGGLTGL